MLCASLVLNRCPRVWGVCRSLYQLRSPQWPFRPTCTRLTECAPKLDMVQCGCSALAGILPRLRFSKDVC